jgi:pyruvate dehydrogenase E1 component alpha subunit
MAATTARKAGKADSDESETLITYYRDMLLIRRFEEKAGQLYGMGLIGGFCHLYIGQEAVVVGCMAICKAIDSVVTSYRDHGHMLATGMDPKGVMAELTGRRGGYSKGKGGSMHMFSREKNFYGGHGIVGAQVPIGTGLGFAHRYKEDGGVSLTFLGDGAINQGQVYESFNMAALWKLPVVYKNENNKYGKGTSVERAAAGKGPYILEALTYRYRGHSMSDPAKYRSKEEVSKMRQEHDPIDHLRAKLLEGGHSDENALKTIDREVKDIVAEAAEFAQASPEPDPSELWTDVLVEA